MFSFFFRNQNYQSNNYNPNYQSKDRGDHGDVETGNRGFVARGHGGYDRGRGRGRGGHYDNNHHGYNSEQNTGNYGNYRQQYSNNDGGSGGYNSGGYGNQGYSSHQGYGNQGYGGGNNQQNFRQQQHNNQHNQQPQKDLGKFWSELSSEWKYMFWKKAPQRYQGICEVVHEEIKESCWFQIRKIFNITRWNIDLLNYVVGLCISPAYTIFLWPKCCYKTFFHKQPFLPCSNSMTAYQS